MFSLKIEKIVSWNIKGHVLVKNYNEFFYCALFKEDNMWNCRENTFKKSVVNVFYNTFYVPIFVSEVILWYKTWTGHGVISLNYLREMIQD